MHLKDYYRILELEPSASLQEIKKAYRRLARLYHPDTNNGDPYAGARFAAIKEAYEVLTNPSKKAVYLQQRWYQQSTGSKKTKEITTPASLLKQSLELNRYVSTLDVHRMDREGLLAHILELLDDNTIEELLGFRETSINEEIIRTMLKTAEPLKEAAFEQVSKKLTRLADKDPKCLELISRVQREHRKQQRREKNEWVLVLILTLLISLMIWLSVR